MNRFFKAVDNSGSVIDIRIADSEEQANVLMLFRPWHHCFFDFTVTECSRQEWFDWHWKKGT